MRCHAITTVILLVGQKGLKMHRVDSLLWLVGRFRPLMKKSSKFALLLFRALVSVTLASVWLSAGEEPARVNSISKKVFCNCGCGEVLAECAHPECKTRVPLKQEIASAVQMGKTDEEILGNMEKKYGATILLVPSFRGFNVFLWIVPLGGVLVVVAVFVWRRWSPGSQAKS